MKLSSIDFDSIDSYHDVNISYIVFSEAEKVLSDDRKKYLRTAAKAKHGQATGVGALSSAARDTYTNMVKQAAVKQLWKDNRQEDEDSDTTPLSDVEYEEVEAQAGSSQKGGTAAKGTPPPLKKRKGPEQQDDHVKEDTADLGEVLKCFELLEAQLDFTFEELCEATSMSTTKVKITGWMLILSKLAETQMDAALAADKLEEKEAHVEKLTQKVEKLKLKNTQLAETITQQQSVIQGIQGLLQQSGPANTE